jgi:Uma2 family endonuclease
VRCGARVIVPTMAPSDPARRAATYDDLLALPEHVVGEIIDGELHVSPRPAPRHVLASSVLGGEIGPPYHGGRGGPGGWWILDEPELHFGGDVVVPDLAGWRRDRMPTLPDEAFFTTAPDWICEVLSPATARVDRLKKLRVYAREAVRHAWLIDPLAQTFEVLQLTQARWSIVAVFGGGDVVRAEPFDAIAIDLSHLWADEAREGSMPGS